MHGDGRGGARFANSPSGGVVGSLEWLGGGFRKNGTAGLILDNGARDLTVTGAYFVDNDGPGLVATAGITAVRSSGFENNLGSGAVVENSASFDDDTFATYGRQPIGVGGYLAGGRVALTGDGIEYYGTGADPTALANVQGQGTLAISGGGNLRVGPNVAVTGVLETEIEAHGATRLVQSDVNYFLYALTDGSGPELRYAGAPVTVGQFGTWAPIAKERIAGGYEVA